MQRIMVIVRGGVVQDVISDTLGAEVMIVDYDNQLGSQLNCEFQAPRVDALLMSNTLKEIV
jgi:hypothetical protein